MSVAASALANGEFQSFIRFDASTAKASFDSAFGPGQWTISSVSLRLTTASPNNAIFNGSATGQFSTKLESVDLRNVLEQSVEAIRPLAQARKIQMSTEITTGQTIVPGDPKLGFAANFLYTLTGNRPDEVMTRAFDVALVLHAEHELNASTFAARVTAATLADIYSAVTSAIGALRGPLHGGANEDVIKLLLEAGTADKVSTKRLNSA